MTTQGENLFVADSKIRTPFIVKLQERRAGLKRIKARGQPPGRECRHGEYEGCNGDIAAVRRGPLLLRAVQLDDTTKESMIKAAGKGRPVLGEVDAAMSFGPESSYPVALSGVSL